MRIFNFLVTFFVVYFSIPVVLILLSWNALPGQKLYKVKTSLEDLVLVLTAKTPLASPLSVSFTERRFSEADKLLETQGSVVGFELLAQQAEESKEIIVRKEDVVQAEVLVEKIEKFQKDIERKTEVAQASQVASNPDVQQNQSSNATQRPILAPTLVAREDVVVPTPRVAPSSQPQEIVSTLQQTQAKLEEIKKEIKREVPEIEQEKEKRNREKNDGSGARDEDKPSLVSEETKSHGSKKDESGRNDKRENNGD